MFKRSIILVGFGVILAAVLGREILADDLIIGGRIFKHSLLGTATIKQVGNLENDPLFGIFTYTITLVAVACDTPSGNRIEGAPARVNVELIGSGAVSQDDAEKKKGRGHVTVVTSTDNFLDPQFCTSAQMIPVEVEVREMDVDIEIFECLDTACTTSEFKSSLKLHCIGQNLEPGDEYGCETLLVVHPH